MEVIGATLMARIHIEEVIDMEGIIWMIVVGFVVGLLARFFYPGAIALGFWMTTLLGIGGSLVGGIIGSLIWKTPAARQIPLRRKPS